MLRKKVVIVEHNKTGQLTNLFKINMHKKNKISSCLKYDGNPFTKSYVKNAIRRSYNMATAKDYRNDIRPNWCPGCGHYGVQAAITDAVVAKIFHQKN